MLCPIAHAAPAELVSTERATLARFPEESLLFGSAKAYVRNGLEYYHRCERIAGIVQTRFLWKPTYIITDPAAIAEVLVKQANSFTKPYVLRRDSQIPMPKPSDPPIVRGSLIQPQTNHAQMSDTAPVPAAGSKPGDPHPTLRPAEPPTVRDFWLQAV